MCPQYGQRVTPAGRDGHRELGPRGLRTTGDADLSTDAVRASRAWKSFAIRCPPSRWILFVDIASLVTSLDQVPGALRSQIADQRADLRVTTPAGERRFAVTTAEDGRITDWERGVPAEPTVRVETD
ncbi:MAG: hypothetical protein U5K37_06475 [Natrialbaceae archaeon]|nr:hypothetical protein [Natrialbaceae archaeon]